MELQFDGACTGRYATSVVAAMSAYRELERTCSQYELHNIHIRGYDPEARSDTRATRAALATWRGFEPFERSLIGLMSGARRHWLIDYGRTTMQALRRVVSSLQGCRILMGNELYRPWRAMLTEAAARDEFELTSMDTRAAIRADSPDSFVSRAAIDVLSREPDVVFMSLVTQDGIRLPIERVMRHVMTEWRSDTRRSFPFFVLDACQAVGRVPIEMDAARDGFAPCALIGCMHKALHGPKEMSFIVCSHAQWRERLVSTLESTTDPAEVFTYARTAGRHRLLPTVDCNRVVGSAAAIGQIDAETIERRYIGVALNQIELEIELRHSGWEVATPSHPVWVSGIVLLRPAGSLGSMCNPHAIKELLAPIAVDELDGYVRIAFDASHGPGVGFLLAQKLNDIARRLN